MRFPRAVIALIIASFIFFISWAVMTRVLTEMETGLDTYSDHLPRDYTDTVDLLKNAFGILCAVFLVFGIIGFFFLESMADEPEDYYRRR